MFLKQIDLTTALRPLYLPDEDLLFVQDNVGLYEGKYKLPNHQNGQVYLTSHRICYVDKEEPRRHSVALDLKDVDRYEFYAGFLKSSAKITLVPKPARVGPLHLRTPGPRSATSSPLSRAGSPSRTSPAEAPTASTATWVCPICSFSNPVPSNFDPTTASAHTPLPRCLACGIAPTLSILLKAAISNARQSAAPAALQVPVPIRPAAAPGRPAPNIGGGQVDFPPHPPSPADVVSADPDASFQCPRCTFLNHPSLLACEICGAPLISRQVPPELLQQPRTEAGSPGPTLNASLPTQNGPESADNVKLSFRRGGEKTFYERLKGAISQRKWLLQGAPPIPKVSPGFGSGGRGRAQAGSGAGSEERGKLGGIAGLERRGVAIRKNNEMVIGSAFEDLEALMASAKEIVALAENFARQVSSGASASSSSSPTSTDNALLAESISQLGLITTKDIVGSSGSGGSSGSDSLYLSELARNLAEFLTDDARGVLRRAGGIISLVDLWAMFNRARGGVELVSPYDFSRAAQLWEPLRLPVRLRTFRKSGVKVVQASDHTDETTVRALLRWLRDMRERAAVARADRPQADLSASSSSSNSRSGRVNGNAHDKFMFAGGITAQDAVERFGWSIGVAEEELEMAEERGALCRGEGLEGLVFWENLLDEGAAEGKAAQVPPP